MYIDCTCTSLEHIIRLSFDKDDLDVVYVDFLLNAPKFWSRLWCGIKYILGFSRNSCKVNEVILNQVGVANLYEFVKQYAIALGKQTVAETPATEDKNINGKKLD